MIYINQLLQNESETDYDIDEGVEEAEWKEICKEQGIELTLGEGEPQEELLEDDAEDPEDGKIRSMQSQMKVLQKLLKQQREELKEKGDMENIIGQHKNFMQLIKSLDDCMRDIAGELKLQATVQQPQLQPQHRTQCPMLT